MKRWLLLAGLLLAVAGCTSETKLPNPSGKGTVRAFNAIVGSPEISYLIEESFLDRMGYRESSGARRWDDFEYAFNFEAAFFGDSESRRVASRLLKVDAGRDYTLVLTGAVDAPTVLTWETAERSFDEAATVFEARFAHAAASLGNVDVYFAADGTAPAIGEQRGTISFGEMLDPIDIESGEYVLTLTTAGDPLDVVYQSSPIGLEARNTFILPVLEGNELDVARYSVRLLNAEGGFASLPDARVPPTIRFFQASLDLPPSDVYDDEMLTNQVLANHAFGDITGDIDIALGTTAYTYTAVGNTGAVQFESGISAAAGTHNNFIVIGAAGSRVATTFVPDRQTVATIAKLRIYHAALNHDELDLYIVNAGETIDEATRSARLIYSLQSGSLVLDAGNYDVYLTVVDEKTIVDGPITVDVQLGDNVEAVIFDTVDPATAEFRIVPAP